MPHKTRQLSRDELKERLTDPKSAQAFVDSLMDTALRVSIERYKSDVPELDAKVKIFDCGHKAFPLPPDQGPVDGCTAVSITIEGVTTVYCHCSGISRGAYGAPARG